MLISTQQIDAFLNSVHAIEKQKVQLKTPQPAFTPGIKGQCACVIDFENKSVTNHHGVSDLFGYTTEEFSFDNILGFVHPQDSEILTRLVYAIADYTAHHVYTSDVTLNVTCRARKKNGEYIKILAQSAIHFKGNNDEVVSYYTLFTDISFMSSSTNFEWKFDAPYLDDYKFKNYVNPKYGNLFSSRELDVVDLISKGFTSQVIAQKLFVSKHTIDTHRRKMLQKTGCTNSVELLDYYRKYIV